ncbi:MAG: AbrB/MazE/SpoVT family DNA-binding domain-containing protein [Candidatus Hydrogenedentes bacterium]|nr:AbrB/MazE/SpoVT family DNA-binding domain-containing protein [Candidatus Hydrogenedentota bacterium]
MNPYRTQLIRVGNSRGIRIPQPLIEQVGLGKEVELSIQGTRLIVRAARRREGWEESFKAMAAEEGDRLLDPETPTEWDETEWTW